MQVNKFDFILFILYNENVKQFTDARAMHLPYLDSPIKPLYYIALYIFAIKYGQK